MMGQHLKQLTALRYFAALWVVFYDYWPHLTGSAPPVIASGHLGVELFFVLSGFILAHVYLEAFGSGTGRYLDFLWARLARIYPVHLAILIGLILLVVGGRLGGLDIGRQLAVVSSLPAQILLLQAWGLSPHGGWNHPSWSISAEWFAYLTFPALAFVYWRLKTRPWLAVGLSLILLAGLNLGFQHLTGQPLTAATIVWGALRIVPCFALGCAIWLVWSSGWPKTTRASWVLSSGGLASVLLLTLSPLPDWLTVPGFAALILGLAGLARAGSRRMTAPLLVYLGEVSFAVYMVCIPWQLVFMGLAAKLTGGGDRLPWPLWLLLVAGVTPAAMVVHHLVERPAREAMRRHGVPFMHRPAPEPPPEPPSEESPHAVLANELWRNTYGAPPTPGVNPALLLRIIAFVGPRRPG